MNRFTGNSTELGGVVHESYVRSAWFPVAVNRIMEWTPLHGSQLSQSDSVELVLPETRLNERTNERFANDSSWRTESRELGHGNESLNPPLVERLVYSNEPESYAGGDFISLASLTRPDRSKERRQTKQTL